MSFWSNSEGEDLSKTEVAKEYEAPGGGDMAPIPDGSTVRALIKEASWAEKKEGGDRHIKIRWDVTAPASVARRVVFQKLWVLDDDPNAKDPAKKRDNALKMLMAIDANCAGKLSARGEKPTDDSLALALIGHEVAITLKVWDMIGSDGKHMEGNWVCAVSPKTKPLVVKDAPAPKADASGGAAGLDDLGDSIPF